MSPSHHLDDLVDLPPPDLTGAVSVAAALNRRRSVREFTATPLTLTEISQLLWAAHGVTEPREGLRTVPSAGALYPLEVYLVLPEGVFHHDPVGHRLCRHADRDLRRPLAKTALGQNCVAQAPAVMILCAVIARTARIYGAEASRYVHMELGHAAQNILLQAVALDLGGVPVGAFHEEKLQAVIGLPSDHVPLYLVPVGRPRPSR